jgi:hypothetical protein
MIYEDNNNKTTSCVVNPFRGMMPTFLRESQQTNSTQREEGEQMIKNNKRM